MPIGVATRPERDLGHPKFFDFVVTYIDIFGFAVFSQVFRCLHRIFYGGSVIITIFGFIFGSDDELLFG